MTPSFGPDDVLLRTQMTPNPWALKFIANHAFKADGKATFNVVSECDHIPLARDLLLLTGVKQVHFFQNTATLTHSGELTSDELREQVESVVKTRLPAHDPNFVLESEKQKAVEKKDRSTMSDFQKQIEEILDRTIRPGLQADGGDVEVVSIEGPEIKIIYQGACGGCPSSMMGTLDAIQGILQNETGDSEIRVRPI